VARSAAAGSGPRQLILLGALTAACALAHAAPPSDAAGTTQKGQALQTAQSTSANAAQGARKPPATGKRNGDAPDAAVLEYLGEFDEAGDGLDAMGLAGDDADTPKPAQGGRR
jgi:hypothetical protein